MAFFLLLESSMDFWYIPFAFWTSVTFFAFHAPIVCWLLSNIYGINRGIFTLIVEFINKSFGFLSIISYFPHTHTHSRLMYELLLIREHNAVIGWITSIKANSISHVQPDRKSEPTPNLSSRKKGMRKKYHSLLYANREEWELSMLSMLRCVS